ncbi:MAG: flagellar biosynthesis anti-sigma factor FlgM [Bdellovibrionales bacterium]|nr:flagellar biosynthesis anti-sigma factor FlgM [Bdellovibrionales bacterium]
MADGKNGAPDQGRKRSLTSLTLQWLSEKIRRTEKLKEEISSGHYEVDSEKIAASLVGGKES